MREREKFIKGSLGLSSAIYKDEVATITARRRAVGLTPPPIAEQDEPTPSVKDGLVGLALSGGGIRSATFSLGVIQALAAKHKKDTAGTNAKEIQRGDYLRYIDYISTVSGGGYIGGSLTWLLHSSANEDREESAGRAASSQQETGSQQNPRKPFGTRPENLPYGVNDPRSNRPRDSKDPVMLRQPPRTWEVPGAGRRNHLNVSDRGDSAGDRVEHACVDAARSFGNGGDVARFSRLIVDLRRGIRMGCHVSSLW